MIHDWVYENRAIYFTELNRLGANITLADPHRVYIQGGTPLKAAQVVCPPALRPSMVILISMLAAKEKATIFIILLKFRTNILGFRVFINHMKVPVYIGMKFMRSFRLKK